MKITTKHEVLLMLHAGLLKAARALLNSLIDMVYFESNRAESRRPSIMQLTHWFILLVFQKEISLFTYCYRLKTVGIL